MDQILHILDGIREIVLNRKDLERDKKLTFNEVTRKGNKIFLANKSKIKTLIVEEAIEDGYLNKEKLELKSKYFEISEKILSIFLCIILFFLIGSFGEENFIKLALIVILPIATVIGIISTINIRRIDMYTQEAKNKKTKLEGLNNYLKDYSLIDKREILEIYLWEKYLAYSTIFNINKNILDELQISLNINHTNKKVYFDRFENKYYYFDLQTGEKKYISEEQEEKVNVDPNNRRLYFLDEKGMKRYL